MEEKEGSWMVEDQAGGQARGEAWEATQGRRHDRAASSWETAGPGYLKPPKLACCPPCPEASLRRSRIAAAWAPAPVGE